MRTDIHSGPVALGDAMATGSATKQPLWRRAVSYTAIGATQDAELLRHPPHGYRPMIKRRRIGHGDARWQYAWSELMTWGVQRHSGLRVEVEPTPPHVRVGTYTPVTFDEFGEPVSAAQSSGVSRFSPDGTELLAPGDSAWLVVPVGPWGIRAPVRVIYVINEVNRRGFAYGTIAGHPEDGEERFVVERRDDGSVWLTVCSFSRPATKFWWMLYPVLLLQQRLYTARYLRSLSGPIPGERGEALTDG